MDQQVITTHAVENITELARRLLEKCGPRDSMKCAIVWLSAGRISQIRLTGIPMDQLTLSLNDLFVRPPVLRSLRAIWQVHGSPTLLECQTAMGTLRWLKMRQVENLQVVRVLNNFLLLVADVIELHPSSNAVDCVEVAP